MSYYQQPMQMRTSSEQMMMRMSGGSQHSQGSQYSQGQAGMRQSWDKRSSGSSAASARDSRGSRGSTEGLRMSSGPEMAGVGIFFQQEPTSGRVYVANIVEGGSADRSGVIRVNDVIVKVDDEDVQGQPLSTLRNLILGKQGTYVVLAFRRMTGTELYYFDVELVRGTPEYFESLKKSQAIQDEKEKLLMQVRQQEQDIASLRNQTHTLALAPTSAVAQASPDMDEMRRDIAAKTEEIKRAEMLVQQARAKKDGVSSGRMSNDQAAINLRAENQHLNQKLVAVTNDLERNKTRYQDALNDWQSNKQRLQAMLDAEMASSNTLSSGGGSARVIEDENQKLRAEIAQKDTRERELLKQLQTGLSTLEEVKRENEANAKLLQEALPTLDTLHAQLFTSVGFDPASAKA